MSSHTTYFCDHCNSDHDIQHPEDEGHAVCYDGLPTYAGWAEFRKPYTGYTGRPMMAENHVCAHCLADPEFADHDYGEVAEWDTESLQSVAAGAAHAAMYADALESIGNSRWPHGVRQVFGDGRLHGPRPHDLSDALRIAYERDGLDTWTGEPKKEKARA